MRTHIAIDDKLISDAIKVSGARTKEEAVERGLKLLIQLTKQEALRGLRGELKWCDDLDRMRMNGRKTTTASYEKDDGALTVTDIARVRKSARRQLPKGEVICRTVML